MVPLAPRVAFQGEEPQKWVKREIERCGGKKEKSHVDEEGHKAAHFTLLCDEVKCLRRQ
jgi:hypothetical protein